MGRLLSLLQHSLKRVVDSSSQVKHEILRVDYFYKHATYYYDTVFQAQFLQVST
jgi:hypothetical protein